MNKLRRDCTAVVVLWTVPFQEVCKAVTEPPLTVNGDDLKVRSVLRRDCILEAAVESGLCENTVSGRRVASLSFLA